jgi:hypothetical protein
MREWVDRAKKCKEERKVEEKRQSHGQQNYNAQNSTPPHHTTQHYMYSQRICFAAERGSL